VPLHRLTPQSLRPVVQDFSPRCSPDPPRIRKARDEIRVATNPVRPSPNRSKSRSCLRETTDPPPTRHKGGPCHQAAAGTQKKPPAASPMATILSILFRIAQIHSDCSSPAQRGFRLCRAARGRSRALGKSRLSRVPIALSPSKVPNNKDRDRGSCVNLFQGASPLFVPGF
jgi:hypothetical protein